MLWFLEGLKLYERQHQITTQAIRLGTFNNMMLKGQPMTLSNIGTFFLLLLLIK